MSGAGVKAQELAAESALPADDWQDAITALGREAQRLLPIVQELVAALGWSPLYAATALLGPGLLTSTAAVGGGVGVNPKENEEA